MAKKKSKTQKQKQKLAKKLSKSFSKSVSLQHLEKKTFRRVKQTLSEDDEYRRQQESLFEREQVMHWKRNQNESKTPIELQKESFSLTKTTDELVDETTRGVHALVGYGNSGLRAGANVAAWAQSQREGKEVVASKNPWDILDDGDDEEEVAAPAPVLRIAAPSFHFQAQTNVDDPDPDL